MKLKDLNLNLELGGDRLPPGQGDWQLLTVTATHK